MTNYIIETRICTKSGKEFSVTQADADFYKKVSPKFGEYVGEIPFPTLCPEERAKRRLSFRNERNLYKRICDATKQPVISVYSPEKQVKVYDQKIWWSDSWDALEYGREFDFWKTFTEQFAFLMSEVPRLSLIWANNTNAQYVHLTADSRNSFMVIESSNAENCLYWYWLQRCQSCIDVSFSESCQHSYEIDNCFDCYKCFHSRNLRDCSNCWYSNWCVGCSFLFGCAWLENKQYCVYNKQYSKEEFESLVLSIWEPKHLEIWWKFPELQNQIKNSEGSTGNYLINTKNCIECVHGYDAEDCKYWEHIWRNAKFLMDVSTVGRDAERIYETINTWIGSFLCVWCTVCWSSNHMFYCDSCFGSSHCFWSIWLRNKQYCIFNKQYTKEEYNELMPKIIEHMKWTKERWEFFDSSLSPFGYNETVAQEQYPLTKEVCLKAWFRWSEYEAPSPQSTNIIDWKDLPLSIDVVPNEIVKYAIRCAKTWVLFKIQPQELAFYRKHGLPIPTLHPNERHIQRMIRRSHG